MKKLKCGQWWPTFGLMLLLPFLAACGGNATPSASNATAAAGTAITVAASAAATASTAPADASASPALTTTIVLPTTDAATTSIPPSATGEPTAPVATTGAITATTTGPVPTASSAAPASTTQTVPLGSKSQLQYGVAAHLYYTDRDRVLTLAGFGNFGWIRQQVPWKDTEKADHTCGCEELDQIVDAVSNKHMKLLLSIVKAPDFATGRKGDNGMPQDPQSFARFVSLLLNRYKGKVQGVEVWNEQNLAVENAGHVTPADAGRYVELLKAGYTAIKAIDPSVIVVAGGLSSTGVNDPAIAVADDDYLKAMYAYHTGEIKSYFDVQGFHPSDTLHSPDEKFGEPSTAKPLGAGWDNSPTHYFRHIEDVRAVMEQAGIGDHKIWITEMGWATKNTTPGYEYGNLISQEQQAAFLESALQRIKDNYDYVGAAFIWNLNFAIPYTQQGTPLDETASFGLLNGDWTPRPAFTRVQGFISKAKSGQ